MTTALGATSLNKGAEKYPGGHVEDVIKTRPWRNWTTQVAFGTAVAVLLGVGALSYRAINVSDESKRWLVHTRMFLGPSI